MAVEEPTLLRRALALMDESLGVDGGAIAAQLRLHPAQLHELLADIADTAPRRPRVVPAPAAPEATDTTDES